MVMCIVFSTPRWSRNGFVRKIVWWPTRNGIEKRMFMHVAQSRDICVEWLQRAPRRGESGSEV